MEEDNWEELENLGNVMELVEDFKKEIKEEKYR